MAIALTDDQATQILKRARCIADSDDRQRFFDSVVEALRDLDPPVRDGDVRRAASHSFQDYRALAERAPTTNEDSQE